MRNNRGFTLIELLVTIAVLGVIAAMALPSFQSVIQKNELKTATSNFLFILNEAKNNARVSQQKTVLRLNNTNNITGQVKIFDVGLDQLGSKVNLISNEKFIAFLANGLVETEGGKYPICVSLEHSKGKQKDYISISQLGQITKLKTVC